MAEESGQATKRRSGTESYATVTLELECVLLDQFLLVPHR